MAARRATNVTIVHRTTSDPREEPGALAAHAGICAGGEEKSSSLPRPSARTAFRLVPPLSAPSQLNGLLLIYLKGSSWLTPTVKGVQIKSPTQDRRCEDQNGRIQRSFDRSSRSTRTICERSPRSNADALIEARRARFRPLRGTDCCLVSSSKSLRAVGAGRKPSLPSTIIVQLCKGPSPILGLAGFLEE